MALPARAPSTYNNQVHGQREAFGMAGDYTLKTDRFRLRVSRPNFKGAQLMFRPFPALDPLDPTRFKSARFAPEPKAHTDWYVSVPSASFVGATKDDKVSFLLYRRDLPGWEEDKRNNPYCVLYYACKAAFDGKKNRGQFSNGAGSWDGQWNYLMKGDNTGGADISQPAMTTYMQGAVIQNDDRYCIYESRTAPDGLLDEDPLNVIKLSETAIESVVDLVDRPGPNGGFLVPEPLGSPGPDGALHGGLLFAVFNPQKTQWRPKFSTLKPGADPNDDKHFKSYQAAASKSWSVQFKGTHNYLGALTPEQAKVAHSKCRFWFDDPQSGDQGLLRFLSIDEQVVLVARAFRAVPLLVRRAWHDHPEWLRRDEVAALLGRRVSVAGAPTQSEDRAAEPPSAPGEDDAGVGDGGAGDEQSGNVIDMLDSESVDINDVPGGAVDDDAWANGEADVVPGGEGEAVAEAAGEVDEFAQPAATDDTSWMDKRVDDATTPDPQAELEAELSGETAYEEDQLDGAPGFENVDAGQAPPAEDDDPLGQSPPPPPAAPVDKALAAATARQAAAPRPTAPTPPARPAQAPAPKPAPAAQPAANRAGVVSPPKPGQTAAAKPSAPAAKAPTGAAPVKPTPAPAPAPAPKPSAPAPKPSAPAPAPKPSAPPAKAPPKPGTKPPAGK